MPLLFPEQALDFGSTETFADVLANCGTNCSSEGLSGRQAANQ